MQRAANGDPYAHLASELGYSYTGHYIVVSGFDPACGNFIVHDPASAAPSIEISGSALEVARKCFGTDEDLLIVAARGLDPTVAEAALTEQRRVGGGRTAAAGAGGGSGEQRQRAD